MNKKEFIKILDSFPDDAKIVLNGDMGYYDLDSSDIEFSELYIIWNNQYNGNGVPYESYNPEPMDDVYPSSEKPDYIWKTIGTISAIILG